MAKMIKLKFPDGAVKEFPQGTTTEDVAASISPGLRKNALAGKVGDKLIDLKTPITEDGEIAIITPQSPEALEILRHSSAHLLAQAVKRKFPRCEIRNWPSYCKMDFIMILIRLNQLLQKIYLKLKKR